MLYDLASDPPEPGSLLESVFLVLTKRRQEQEFLKTRSIIEASLAQHLEGKSKISEVFTDYMNSMFPFLKRQKSSTEAMMQQALKQWTGHRGFKVRPLWMAKDKPARFRSSLARGREKVAQRERLRREGRSRRVK